MDKQETLDDIRQCQNDIRDGRRVIADLAKEIIATQERLEHCIEQESLWAEKIALSHARLKEINADIYKGNHERQITA